MNTILSRTNLLKKPQFVLFSLKKLILSKLSLMSALFVILFLFSGGISLNQLLAQTPQKRKKITTKDKRSRKDIKIKQKKVISEKTEEKKQDNDQPQVTVKKRDRKKAGYYPEISGHFYYTLPLGDLGSYLNAGMGGRFHFSIDTLRILGIDLGREGLNTRIGFNLGYHLFSFSTSEYTSQLSLLPILPYFELNYTLAFGQTRNHSLRLHTHASYGFTFMEAKKTYSVNTINNQRVSTDERKGYALDQTIEYSVGLLYKHKNVPNVAYFLDFSYMMVAETTMGNFLHISTGVAYHFYK